MAVTVVLTGTGRNCTLTSGTNTIVVSSATGLVVGATIQGTGIPTGSRIRSISGTTVVMETATGADSNATVTGTQSLIFSSVWGSVVTISMSASGDTANMDSIYNAGFGVKQRGLAVREIYFPGALGVIWRDMVAGSVFDFQNWTIEFGSGGYWAWSQSSIFGELRGGYLVNGTQFIKSAGPTFISNNFKNSALGGANMFIDTATGTVTGTFRMNNMRTIYQVGSNTAPFFSCGRMNCIVDNMILDYQGGSGPNAGIGAAFGALNNTTIVRANSGIGNPNPNNFATINGLSYSGIYTDSPNHKFSIPNNYVLEGYAPQVLSTQTLGGFQDNTTETFANIDLSTAGWGVDDLKTKYFRYGGPNEIRFPRKVSFEFNDSTGADLTGVTLYIKSGSLDVINAVQSGDYSANTQALVLIWTTTTNAYRVRDSFIDTIAQVAQVRKYGFLEQITNYSLNFESYSQPFFMLTNIHISLITEVEVQTYSNVTLNYIDKKVVVNGVFTPNKILAKINYELAQTANSSVANFSDVQGTSLVLKNGWTIEVTTNGIINKGTSLDGIVIEGEQIINNGSINIPFSDIDGSRVAVTNLDPENFGVTWNLRYKLAAESTWTELTGTGNSATILTSLGLYDLQARVAGYTWKTIQFDTNESLAVDLGLIFHVADDGTPQYLKPYNSSLVDIFEYNDTEMSIEVTNTTGTILQPSFNEMYQVVEKVQQDPTLVWLWVNPVTTNATSQKVLIPSANPLTMYLSVDSDASVKITCPVVYADTGISADDKVKGNPAGYSIILGSSATADSSLIVSQLVEQLGGNGFMTNQHSLVKVVEAVGETLQADDYVAPDNTAIGEIKTKVDTLENTDLTGIATATNVSDAKDEIITEIQAIDVDLTGVALEATSQELITKVDAIQTTVDDIDVDFTPVLDAIDTKPTLAEIEASTVLASADDVTDAVSDIHTDLVQLNEGIKKASRIENYDTNL